MGGSASSEERHTVLLIEDEELTRQAYTHILEATDAFDPIAVESAEAAQACLRECGFDVSACLVDLFLPGEGGEAFVQWVKREAPHIATIVLTGCQEDESFLRCLRHGAIDFLLKPVHADKLVETLSDAIQRQRRFSEEPGGIESEHFQSDWVELTAPSEMEYLSRLQRFTETLLLARLPEPVREDLRLAIEEVGRNAIEWGNKFDREKRVRISYCVFPDRIVFKFEDEGEGFNPYALPDPTTDPINHIRNRKDMGKRPGGFGVFLIQRLMDEVVYSDRGNIVVMSKYLRPDV